MESVKNIRNDELVKAYEALHTDNSKERQAAVTRQMVHAVFLLPVTPVKGKLPEDFPPKVLKNEQGQMFLPLFTDAGRVGKAIAGLGDVLLPIDISDAYAYFVDKPELRGLIVNPFSKPNLVCVRPMVENLAKLWSHIKTAELNNETPEAAPRPQSTGQQVKLLVPKEYPDGVTFTLSAGLKAQEDIEKAWMCMVQKAPDDKPEERDWMVILQAGKPLKGREEIFRAIGQSLSPFLPKRNVIFIENNAGMNGLTEQAMPIYVRESKTV